MDVISVLTSNEVVQSWIAWPVGDIARVHSAYFQQKYHLPNIIGVVDGTHIEIQAPANNRYEAAYVNRKQYHSLNAQIVCGADYRIIHVDISNVGSAHDASVWAESDVPRLVQQDHYSLLGDSAYPSRCFLLTPYPTRNFPLNPQQQTFQRWLLAARQNVEQTIGILKQRFQVLNRKARYSLDKVPSVVLACCVLHNICRHFSIPLVGPPIIDDDNDVDDIYPPAVGNAVRQQYIDRHIL
ncbi:UNVERIFIED_CONTAM: hypothetical protein GTU68_027344 [Idotea baltica]|nr:hypothetical protein [Idotea baltica]